MIFFSDYLIKITWFIILWERHLVLGEVYCKYLYFGCRFTEIVTNETHPYFQPTSRNPHPLNISLIFVQNSRLPILTDELCNVFSNLLRLKIQVSTLKRIQDGALNACVKLERFSAVHNEITKVSANIFIKNPEITAIDFSYNKLTFVDVKVFEPTKKLVGVNLNNNYLVHFDFRAMPLLQHLETFALVGNNLLDLDDYAVLEKLPNLLYFGFTDNLLDCRNLKLMLGLFNNTNVTIQVATPYRKRTPTFVRQMEEGFHCLNRTEHLKASAYYLNEMRIAATNISCPDKSQPKTDEQQYLEQHHVIIIQFVSTILICCCITKVIWHGFYWRKTVNHLFDDNGDYYYCNYFRANDQNERSENVETST